MRILSGKKKMPQRVVIYGPEGIGKSTLASQFPNPLVIDTEGSTYHLDVKRFEEKPSSWQMLLSQVKYVLDNSTVCKTLVIDTADWAEKLAKEHIMSVKGWTSLSQPGWGEGFTELEATFGSLLNGLTQIYNKGLNIVLVAHAQIKTFTKPDETGSYDRYELKLEKKVAALVKEWADTIIFINYETFITSKDKQGKGTATGGKRVMHLEHKPAWDAKNRWGLNEDSYPLNYEIIRPFIFSEDETKTRIEEPPRSLDLNKEDFKETQEESPFEEKKYPKTNVDPKLQQLMDVDGFELKDVMAVIYAKGIYPPGTPYENMDINFIQGAVIGQWDGLRNAIKKLKQNNRIRF